MNIYEINELHYITPLQNLPSIFSNGILSHNLAEGVKTSDISMESVQDIRAKKIVPNGLDKRVHDYAVLYFNAKNPMLSSRRDKHEEICVLRIKPDVLRLEHATVSDRNAAVNLANFYPAMEGIHHLQKKILQGKYWTSKFQSDEINKTNGQYRCAELLVPGKIHPSNIGGAYVSCEKTQIAFNKVFNNAPPVPVTVNPDFFFQPAKTVVQPAPLSNSIFPEVKGFDEPVPNENHSYDLEPVEKKQKLSRGDTETIVPLLEENE